MIVILLLAQRPTTPGCVSGRIGRRWRKRCFFPELDIGPLLRSVEITVKLSLLATFTAFAEGPTTQIQRNTLIQQPIPRTYL